MCLAEALHHLFTLTQAHREGLGTLICFISEHIPWPSQGWGLDYISIPQGGLKSAHSFCLVSALSSHFLILESFSLLSVRRSHLHVDFWLSKTLTAAASNTVQVKWLWPSLNGSYKPMLWKPTSSIFSKQFSAMKMPGTIWHLAAASP